MNVLRTTRSAVASAGAILMVTTGIAAAGVAASPLAEAATQTVRSSNGLNVRSAPDVSAPVIGGLPNRATVETTGSTQDGWVPIQYQGRDGWVSARYLGEGIERQSAGAAFTTSFLKVRTGPGIDEEVVTVLPKGARVDTTGKARHGYTQIRHDGEKRWVSSRYLSSDAPEAAPAPAPVVAPKGNSTQTLGNISGASRVSLPGLTANTRAGLASLSGQFPQVSTILGVRPDSLPDHPSGRALDFMVPVGSSLGDQLAEHARANAGALGIDYIIWNQRIWSTGRASEGWRFMADRGSVTANHRDHVHITFR